MKKNLFHRFFCLFVILIRFREGHPQAYTGILAGGNGCGWSGDGGPATSAKVNSPYGVWSDSMGNVYFSELTGNRVRVVNSAGIINTIVGTGNTNNSGFGGPGVSTSLDWTLFLVGDTGSNLYIGGNYFTWRYSFSTLQVTRVIGSSANYSYTGDGGPATSASMRGVRGLAISTSGTLYVSDNGNCIIRAVNTSTNIITLFAGSPPISGGNTLVCGFSGDGGPATSAQLKDPIGIWLSSNNDLYIAVTYNNRIRRVTNNIITTFAGTGSSALGSDGVAATSSALKDPVGVTGDSLGNIYISERSGCRIRIVITGIISTILGTGTCGSAGFAYQVASSAAISSMYQIWVDTMDNVYVPQIGNCIVRKVTSAYKTPTSQPSSQPTQPSSQPTSQPSEPTSQPSNQPTTRPSTLPTSQPSNQPTTRPSTQPTSQPSNQPTTRPSTLPTSQPSNQPTTRPSTQPTSQPSNQPTTRPSTQPTSFPVFRPYPSTFFPSFKEALFLFGSFSSVHQSFTFLDASPSPDSPSSIIFGSKSLSSSPLTVNVSCSSVSCQYPVAHISASYKRDTTSRAAVVPGDVNGDAYNDLIVCSPLTSVCNIYFGKEEDGLRNATIGVTISGPSSSSTTSSSSQPAATFFGFAVAGAEDMNGDGLADVLVSSLTGRAVYVIYGRRSWSSVFRVSEMRSGEDGYKIVADSSTTLTGISVSGVGDMNGDGRKDVALSVQRGGLFMVYVIWGEGGVGGGDVSLGEVVNGVKGLSVTGEQGYYTGLSISGLGDVNDDGMDDLLIGAIPYPDRAKNPPQKSYVILGSSAGLSDIVLGGSVVGVVSIVGGGFMVSGPGDVNDDGIDDIMITNVRDYVGKGNAYIISYPSRMTSSPSLVPSSFPSSSPSHAPSSEPSSFFPSPSPSSSLPNHTTSHKPSFHPTISPTMTAVPSLRPTTRNPTVRPSFFSTVAKTSRPSLNPSQSSSPSIIPTLAASLNLSSLLYIVRVVNSTSSARSEIVYGVEGANERFEISSMSSDGRRRSGWSGTIIGGRGRKVYVIYPKDPLQPVNRIILEDFDKTSDVLDLSHISQIASKADLTYLTNPLTLFLPDNQKIVLSNCQTMNDLTDENFVFQSAKSSSSSEFSMKDLYVVIPLFGSMMILLILSSPFSVCNEEKEVKDMGIDKEEEEDLTEDERVDQVEMNVNIEDAKEDSKADSISMSKSSDDISCLFEDVFSSADSIREYDEESLLIFAINFLNRSTIQNKGSEDEDKSDSDFL